MRICVLLPGKIKPRVLLSAQEEYAGRLKTCNVELVEYKDEKISSRSAMQVKEAEAGRIFKFLKNDDYLIVCDERGKRIETSQLVEVLKTAQHHDSPFTGKRRIVIVIGGALGLADSVRSKADTVWSLSSLVMAGGVARIVLLEGLYRAITIVKGHPYHND